MPCTLPNHIALPAQNWNGDVWSVALEVMVQVTSICLAICNIHEDPLSTTLLQTIKMTSLIGDLLALNHILASYCSLHFHLIPQIWFACLSAFIGQQCINTCNDSLFSDLCIAFCHLNAYAVANIVVLGYYVACLINIQLSVIYQYEYFSEKSFIAQIH